MDPLSLLAIATTALAVGVQHHRQTQGSVTTTEDEYAKAWAHLLSRPEVQANPDLSVYLDRLLEKGMAPPGYFWNVNALYPIPELPDEEEILDPPFGYEVFREDPPSDLIIGILQDRALDGEEWEDEEDYEWEQEQLAGWYWWCSMPGCLPDSDAFGPFETREEAVDQTWDRKLEEELGFMHYDDVRGEQREDGYWLSLQTPYGRQEVGPFRNQIRAEIAVRGSLAEMLGLSSAGRLYAP